MRKMTNAEQHKEMKASATVGMSGIILGPVACLGWLATELGRCAKA